MDVVELDADFLTFLGGRGFSKTDYQSLTPMDRDELSGQYQQSLRVTVGNKFISFFHVVCLHITHLS